MHQIKIFEGNGNNENDANAWLKDNPDVEVKFVSLHTIYDFWGAGDCPDTLPQICNQWIATVLVYEMKTPGEDKNVNTH
jgi:hypothetical protein